MQRKLKSNNPGTILRMELVEYRQLTVGRLGNY